MRNLGLSNPKQNSNPVSHPYLEQYEPRADLQIDTVSTKNSITSDVIEALTDSSQPGKYWTAMKARVSHEDGFQLCTICRQLKLESSDGKKHTTNCTNTEGVFRLIQSTPSPKAEPFKRWLAKVGYERVQEIENPE